MRNMRGAGADALKRGPAKAGRVFAVHTCSVLPLISPAFILWFPCRWIKERERRERERERERIDYISSGLGLNLPQPAREHFHRYRRFQDPAGSSDCASVQATGCSTIAQPRFIGESY